MGNYGSANDFKERIPINIYDYEINPRVQREKVKTYATSLSKFAGLRGENPINSGQIAYSPSFFVQEKKRQKKVG